MKFVQALSALGFTFLSAAPLSACISEPAPEEFGSTHFETADDLKDALVANGVECESWERTDVVNYSSSSGNCGAGKVIAVFPNEEAKRRAALELMKFPRVSKFSLVFGETWTLVTPEDRDFAETFGAHVLTLEPNA